MRREATALAMLVMVLALAVTAWADAPVPGEAVVPFVVSGAVQSPYLTPFAFSDALEASYGQLYTFMIKTTSWQSGCGQAGLINLGNGDSLEQVAGTVSNSLLISDLVSGMPVNNFALRQAMDSRIDPSGYGDSQYSQWFADGCPADARIIVCPVVSQGDLINGHPSLTLTGFLGFYVDAYEFGTTGNSITGTFAYLPEGSVAVPEPSALVALSSLAFGALALRKRRT